MNINYIASLFCLLLRGSVHQLGKLKQIKLPMPQLVNNTHRLTHPINFCHDLSLALDDRVDYAQSCKTSVRKGQPYQRRYIQCKTIP